MFYFVVDHCHLSVLELQIETQETSELNSELKKVVLIIKEKTNQSLILSFADNEC